MRFLFICFGMDAATSLGTTVVNIFMAGSQLCAISAGLLADKVLGESVYESLILQSCHERNVASFDL